MGRVAKERPPLNAYPSPPLIVLSLGAGVQSSCIALLSARGLLPRIDLCVFADTRWEPAAVYRHVEWLLPALERHGIPTVVASKGDIRTDALDFRQHCHSADGKRHASIPVFVKNPDGSQGRVGRQCTKEYKVEVVENVIRRKVLGLAFRQRAPRSPAVEQWLGISADEARRMRFPGTFKTVRRTESDPNLLDAGATREVEERVFMPTAWKTHTYPLLGVRCWPDRSVSQTGYLERPWTRQDCLAWLAREFPGREFPRSACVGCPFRSNEEWRHLRDTSPEDWADAVAFDRDMRVREAAGRRAARRPLTGEPYLHRQMVPLDQVDFGGPGVTGQGCGLLGDESTGGYCGG